MAEPLMLYRVTYDGQSYHVEAPSFWAAIVAWRDYVRGERKEGWDGTEQPESVCLMNSDHPVIRRVFSERTVGMSDHVDTHDYSSALDDAELRTAADR